MKIAFIDTPLGKNDEKALEDPNIGILSIIAYLRKYVPAAIIKYFPSYDTKEEQLHKIIEFDPAIIGFSFTTFCAKISFEMIDAIKDRFPDKIIICGGTHATTEFEDVLLHSKADLCCVGEGEETMLELVNCLDKNERWTNIDGIAYRSKNGIILNKERKLIEDLDAIPFPAWDIIDFNNYTGVLLFSNSPVTTLIASRGCPYNCVFCSVPVWKNQKPWIRFRSPKSIIEEIVYLYSRGIREIYIQSDEINPNIEWSHSVFEAISDLNLIDLYFQVNLRATPIDVKLVELLRKSNCWLVHIGVESVSERVLKGINKKITFKDILDSCKLLKKGGIESYLFFSTFHYWEEKGILQKEKFREVLWDIVIIIYLRMRGLIQHFSWTIATPAPGSELYKLALKNKLIHERFWDKGKINFHKSIYQISRFDRMKISIAGILGVIVKSIFILLSGKYKLKNFRIYIKKGLRRMI